MTGAELPEKRGERGVGETGRRRTEYLGYKAGEELSWRGRCGSWCETKFQHITPIPPWQGWRDRTATIPERARDYTPTDVSTQSSVAPKESMNPKTASNGESPGRGKTYFILWTMPRRRHTEPIAGAVGRALKIRRRYSSASDAVLWRLKAILAVIPDGEFSPTGGPAPVPRRYRSRKARA